MFKCRWWESTPLILWLWMCKCTRNVSTKWASLIIIKHKKYSVFQRKHAVLGPCVVEFQQHSMHTFPRASSSHQSTTRASRCPSTATTVASGGWWRPEASNWSCCTKGELQTSSESSFRCWRPHGSVDKIRLLWIYQQKGKKNPVKVIIILKVHIMCPPALKVPYF